MAKQGYRANLLPAGPELVHHWLAGHISGYRLQPEGGHGLLTIGEGRTGSGSVIQPILIDVKCWLCWTLTCSRACMDGQKLMSSWNLYSNKH